MFLFKRTDIELIAGIFDPGPEFGVEASESFFQKFEKFGVLKNIPCYGFLIFLKILKNWNAIFQMRRLKSSGYL